MNEKLWQFIDATGKLWSKSYGMPPMTGRVLAYLLVCDPPEQTAAQIGEALDASKGSISGATNMLVSFGLADRFRLRGERADRFRIRPDAWDQQVADQGAGEARALIGLGLEALAAEPAGRRARLEDLDTFYGWWQERAPRLVEEWQQYKRERKRDG